MGLYFMTSFLTTHSDLVNKNGKSWVLVGSPKDGQKPTGSLSSCQVDFARPRDISCQVRPPNLSGAPEGDIFDDQLLGVSVLTVSRSGANTEVIRTIKTNSQKLERNKNTFSIFRKTLETILINQGLNLYCFCYHNGAPQN